MISAKLSRFNSLKSELNDGQINVTILTVMICLIALYYVKEGCSAGSRGGSYM